MEIENEEIARIIRMEQRASSLNKRIRYNETLAYRNMNKMQRKDFEEYMNKKGRTRHFLLIAAILFYVAFGIFYFRVTGNAVRGVVGNQTFSFLGGVLNFLFIIVTSLIIIMFLIGSIKEERFRRNFNIKKYLYQNGK